MGRGSKTRNDPPMRPPVDILAEVREMQSSGEGAGPSAPDAAAFCEREHSVPFRVVEGGSATAGDTIHLGVEDPPTVISAGRVVGVVTEPHAHAMRGCVAMGYRMQGTVTAVDLGAGTGTLVIAGEVAQAA